MQLISSGLHQATVYAGSSLIAVNAFDSTLSVGDIVNGQIKQSDIIGKEDAFYVVNLGDIVSKYLLWHQKLPRIEPFYGKDIFADTVVSFVNGLWVFCSC